MDVSALFGDLGTKILSFFSKKNHLQWLVGGILILSALLRFLSQESSFPLMESTKRSVEHIQSYIPFIMKCVVPIIDSLFVTLILAITVLSILRFLPSKSYLPKWQHCANKWTTISIFLLIQISVFYASFLIIASAADISQALAHRYHFWLPFALVYLYFFLTHMFNLLYSWVTGIDSSKEIIGASAVEGRNTVTLADRNIANRYINERSAPINSMRDQFANNLNVGQAYLSEVANREGYKSIEQWIEKHARDAAIKEARSIKRENRDLDSSHE
jgi:hypothetical protein